MMVAWYLHDRPLPPRFLELCALLLLIVVPTVLIARQPDLGTALLIASSGLLGGAAGRAPACGDRAAGHPRRCPRPGAVVLHARLPAPAGADLPAARSRTRSAPAITSSSPRSPSDPAACSARAGSTAARPSWNSCRNAPPTSSLPSSARSSGSSGWSLLLVAYLFIVGRGLYIAVQAQDTFGRLLAGSISLTFFVYVFVNTGMVTGLLPVVGVPLPLVSYGGTSMVTLMAGFGMLMSIQATVTCSPDEPLIALLLLRRPGGRPSSVRGSRSGAAAGPGARRRACLHRGRAGTPRA